jgi:glycosyltransferase involved in cell wall biosynthesis
MARHLKKLEPDLVFYPFNAASINLSHTFPSVVVIHDLFYKNFPCRSEKLSKKTYASYVDLKHRKMLKKADRIVTISDFVKADIMRHFPQANAQKISVIPNTVVMSQEVAELPGINRPFLFNIGEHAVHKNHITLLKAFNAIKSRIPHELVIVGGRREETAAIHRQIEVFGLHERVRLISGISDANRNWLYKNADLFVLPSLHEGFGRPPVEAAMLGTMVLSSSVTSLSEVTRGLLNYYDPPCDENVLAARILELLGNPVAAAEREHAARVFKELYDPARIARMYYMLFQDVLAGGR